ncbi:MAG: hypothetical protein U1E76_24515 [Planctomycetota bacterium]
MRKSAFVIVYIWLACAQRQSVPRELLPAKPVPSPAQVDAGDRGPYPKDYVELLERYVQETWELFDPDSLKIKAQQPEKDWIYNGNQLVFTWSTKARWNAKNRMGGYAGYFDELSYHIKDGRIIGHEGRFDLQHQLIDGRAR